MFRRMIDWGKRVVVEAIVRELTEEASEATGYVVLPMTMEFSKETPALEYEEE